ncbi:MAG TPA: histidine triad nucleotide-binding protein [Bacillota bacterium]|nr:histidine triad nucleotide-binding protein [Bacillota bacterium]
MQDCIFCKIVRKEIPSNMVYEDDLVMAFHDISPVAPVHVLLIPKKHISTHFDITAEDTNLIGHIHLVASRIAEQLDLGEKGFRLISNCKEHGGQTVFHLHFHLLGGQQFRWPPG